MLWTHVRSLYMEHIQMHALQGLLVLFLWACCWFRSVSIHNKTNSTPHPPPLPPNTPPSPTHMQLMWCPFHCWMPCCCPKHYIHPAMMSVLGWYSQLVHAFKASMFNCVIICQLVLEASLCLLLNHAIKLSITRQILAMCRTWHPLLLQRFVICHVKCLDTLLKIFKMTSSLSTSLGKSRIYDYRNNFTFKSLSAGHKMSPT